MIYFSQERCSSWIVTFELGYDFRPHFRSDLSSKMPTTDFSRIDIVIRHKPTTTETHHAYYHELSEIEVLADFAP